MPLHMIKLCVGVETVGDLQDWVRDRLALARRENRPEQQVHVTRMIPKRGPEILDGGSLYWVIKGHVQVRQRILDLQAFTDDAGIQRCRIVLEPVFAPTEWSPRRPFQGWRYLADEARPPDLDPGRQADGLPPSLMRELASLGLL